MLEQFHIPSEIEVRVDPRDMRATVEDLLEALGMPRADAEQSADVLLYADTRGIDSHGVSNMLRVYVQGIRDGRINLHPEWHITHESPGGLHDRLGRRPRRRNRTGGDAPRDRASARVRHRFGRRPQWRSLRRGCIYRGYGPGRRT